MHLLQWMLKFGSSGALWSLPHPLAGWKRLGGSENMTAKYCRRVGKPQSGGRALYCMHHTAELIIPTVYKELLQINEKSNTKMGK